LSYSSAFISPYSAALFLAQCAREEERGEEHGDRGKVVKRKYVLRKKKLKGGGKKNGRGKKERYNYERRKHEQEDGERRDKRGELDEGKRGARKYKAGGEQVAYRRNKASYINTFTGLFVIFCAEPHQTDCDVHCRHTPYSHIDYTR